jgi:hypothetical protein
MSLSAQAAHMAELRTENEALRRANIDLSNELARRISQITTLNREIAVMRAMQVVVDARATVKCSRL